MPPFMRTDCKTKCDDKRDYCSLTIGGPKVYIWLTMIAYIATIMFYFFEHVINLNFKKAQIPNSVARLDDTSRDKSIENR